MATDEEAAALPPPEDRDEDGDEVEDDGPDDASTSDNSSASGETKKSKKKKVCIELYFQPHPSGKYRKNDESRRRETSRRGDFGAQYWYILLYNTRATGSYEGVLGPRLKGGIELNFDSQCISPHV